jgi:hypothetical protein
MIGCTLVFRGVQYLALELVLYLTISKNERTENQYNILTIPGYVGVFGTPLPNPVQKTT